MPMNRPGVVVEDLELSGVDAYLVRPEPGGRGPGVLFLHWFDPEASDGNRTQFLEEAADLAAEIGVVSVLPQGKFPWEVDPSGAENDVRSIEEEVARHRLAVDHLASRADVDDRTIAVVGHDFGGMHGLVFAASDERVCGAVAIAVTPRWGDWFLPFWRIPGDRFDYLRRLSPLDPVSRIGDMSPRRVLLQFSESDFYIAPMAAHELARSCEDACDLRFYESDHAMRSPEAARDRATFLEAVFAVPSA
jgi:pimeloyl-ACP methyl ester carboxylesterase